MNIRLPRLTPLILALGLALAPTARAAVETFNIDNTHSFANWEVRHVVARTSGTFWDVKGKVMLDTDNIARSSVDATISIYSLNSSHLRRDVHVLTDEFLDARNYPEMKFVSTAVKPATADKGTLTGQLTLHGVTKPVTLNYEILGMGQDPWGGMRIGFQATTRINRSDYGITKYTPTGPVGNEVEITLLIEGIKLGADGQPWNAKKAAEEEAARKAAEDKAKAISYPAASPAPAATPAPAKKDESLEDQLKKKLKGFMN
ncbi:MAG TPA: YceI family protein [Thiobacillaceae bacterium]|nr:YceI family protein [Thiobacillaceae bacterium]HNI08458.1 YceI family protein [Thiobacillaceae bacterium]